MELLIVTSEIAPYSQRGEIADLSRGLTRALHNLGHSVTVLSPLYKQVDPNHFSLARRLSTLTLTLGDREFGCELFDGRTASGVHLLFLASRELFAAQEGMDESGERAMLQAGLLGRAAAKIAAGAEPGFDAIQAHESMASLALVWARKELPRVARVLLAHDLVHQGRMAADLANTSWLDSEAIDSLRIGNELSLLKGGMLAADRIVSASPGALDAPGSEEDRVRMRAATEWMENRLASIPNGLDTAVWNPATDIHLKSRFDPVNLSGKGRCKATLQHELGLPVRPDLPLLFCTGDLSREKGGALLALSAPDLLRNDLQMVVLSNIETEATAALGELGSRFSDRIVLRVSPDQALIHQALAASDLLLLPSPYEPYAILQMCAHRYGVLPVARRAGSVADTVVDCDSSLRTGTGFLHESHSPEQFVAATQRGASAFRKNAAFEKLRRKVMLIDHSWERRAQRYESLYQRLNPPALTLKVS